MSRIGIEIIGLISTLLILVSMVFKTTTYKGSLIMRILNLIGSLIFVIYGLLLPAIMTAVLNICVIIIHIFHIVILVREHKKLKNIENNKSNKGNEHETK